MAAAVGEVDGVGLGVLHDRLAIFWGEAAVEQVGRGEGDLLDHLARAALLHAGGEALGQGHGQQVVLHQVDHLQVAVGLPMAQSALAAANWWAPTTGSPPVRGEVHLGGEARLLLAVGGDVAVEAVEDDHREVGGLGLVERAGEVLAVHPDDDCPSAPAAMAWRTAPPAAEKSRAVSTRVASQPMASTLSITPSTSTLQLSSSWPQETT